MKRSEFIIILICVLIWLVAAGIMQLAWVEHMEMTTVEARFFDIEDSRDAGKTMPLFITACNLTYVEIDGAEVWDPKTNSDHKADDEKKIKHLVPRRISPQCFGSIPSDYPYADNAS